MKRTLTAARVSVRAGREEEYLSLLEQRHAAATRAGFRFWVFRNQHRPGQFLEFTESAEGRPPESDAELDARMRAIAYYASDATDVWNGVELPSA